MAFDQPSASQRSRARSNRNYAAEEVHSSQASLEDYERVSARVNRSNTLHDALQRRATTSARRKTDVRNVQGEISSFDPSAVSGGSHVFMAGNYNSPSNFTPRGTNKLVGQGNVGTTTVPVRDNLTPRGTNLAIEGNLTPRGTNIEV